MVNRTTFMNVRKILITSPSLNTKENVSGVSSLIAGIISHSKLDFIHFELGSKDGIKKNLIWLVSQVKTYLKIILVSMFRRYEFVHLNVGLEKASIIRDSLVFFIVNMIFKKKVVLHIHGGYYLMHKCQSRMLNFLLKKIFKHAHAIIVLSDLEKEILSQRYSNLSFNVIPNAVDITSLNGLSKQPVNSNIRFVFMARIVNMKGIYTISESLQYLTKYFNRFSFDIYGAGPDLEDWLSELKKYPAFKFTYHGVVGGIDKWKALSDSDVLLLPSFYEGLPITMLEAMAAGCLVIITDIGSVKTVITDSINGILLSESSPKLLAAKIQDVIDGKIDAKAIGNNAKYYVEANLSMSSYISKLETLYSTL